jgi:hypothetical protein
MASEAAGAPVAHNNCEVCRAIAKRESAGTKIRATDLVSTQCACPRCRQLCLGVPGRTCPEDVQQMLRHACKTPGDIEELVPKLAIDVEQPSARAAPVRILRPRTVKEQPLVGLAPIFLRAGACVFLDPERGCTLPRCAVPTTCRLTTSCRPQLQRQAAEQYGAKLRSVATDAWNTGKGRRLLVRFEQAVHRLHPDAPTSVDAHHRRLATIANPIGEFALRMHAAAVTCANGTGDGYKDTADTFHTFTAHVRSATASGGLAILGGWYEMYKADINWACEAIEAAGFPGMFQRIYDALREGAEAEPRVRELRDVDEKTDPAPAFEASAESVEDDVAGEDEEGGSG